MVEKFPARRKTTLVAEPDEMHVNYLFNNNLNLPLILASRVIIFVKNLVNTKVPGET